MISWSYYGEQGMVYLARRKVRACLQIRLLPADRRRDPGPRFKTDADLDNMTGVGTAVILFANIPICWIFGHQAMRAYHDYVRRLKDGRMGPDHPAPSLEDLISGKDVQR